MLEPYKKLVKKIREKGIIEAVRAILRFMASKGVKSKRKMLLLYLKLRSKDGLVLREILGSKMYLDTSDPGISEELLFTGIHEELATKIFSQEISRGMTIVDIGANLGYYALLEASIIGEEGQVYALEPVRKNFDILIKNIAVNGYKNVKAYCKAVSSKSGTSTIALTDESNWGSMLDMKAETTSDYMKQKMYTLTRQVIAVDTVSLDDFLDQEGINQINVIRMDIEGYEVEAIKGMLNTLKNTQPPLKLFFEIHNKVFDNPETTTGYLLEQLLSLGFKPKCIILPNKILHNVSKDDFVQIVCSFKSDCPHCFLEKVSATEKA